MLKRKRVTHHPSLGLEGTEVSYPGVVQISRRYFSDDSDTESVYDMAEHIASYVENILRRVVRSFVRVGNRRRRLR